MQDRDGGILLLATLFGMYPFLQTLFADAGYQGPKFHNTLRTILPHLETQIVKRSDQKRFAVLPKRWIVERTLAWLNRCRRLAKDWENLNRKALAIVHHRCRGSPRGGNRPRAWCSPDNETKVASRQGCTLSTRPGCAALWLVRTRLANSST